MFNPSIMKMHALLTGGPIRRLLGDKRGVAAIEFAFVVPILLVCYMGAIEIGFGISANKKVGRAAAIIGDLVAQEDQTTTVGEIRGAMRAGSLIREPYNRTPLTITVTAIQISTDSAPVARVVWSQRLVGDNTFSAPFAADSVVALPQTLMVPGAFIIRTSAEMQYQPAVVWTLKDKGGALDMSETYYHRPRFSQGINCNGC
jgi:Flp pilus assembly protein TadG